MNADCNASANALTFGTSGALLTSASDMASSLSVVCTKGTAYNVGLSAGATPGATTTMRKMVSADQSSTINYALFQDSTRTTNWGNTVGTDTVPGVGSGLTQTLMIYSRIPAQPSSTVASYSDTVTATISY